MTMTNAKLEVSLISPRLPHFFYGGDYNPEQWSEEVWLEDVRLMREAGVNLVSLGIFSWAKLEPRPGEYNFDWLDKVIDLLYANGVMVDLATTTASPPPWLAKLHPESLPVDQKGEKLWPGSRQQYCPNSVAYRQGVQNLVRRVAEHYKDHPALVMWHINNEYAAHVPECYCEVSAEAFREWLGQRYGTLENLNKAWGTAFWSQHYSEWDEINPPRLTPTFINPTQQIDFKRFSSDALLECYSLEAEILREITPDIPVTTNFMSFFKPLDYWKWAAKEDVVSNDAYPDPSDPEWEIEAAAACDLMRSLGNGKPWVLMEQATSQVNWRSRNVLKRPGQMRQMSYQAVARGANGIMFFQWRASQAGAEKYHGALVPHIGTEGSRVWREVTQLGAELGQLDNLLKSAVKTEVAIVMDWESWWGLEIGSKPSTDIKQLEQIMTYYKPLFQQNITTDFVKPDGDLSKYRVVLVPNLYMVSDAAAQNLEQYVANGGTLVMSFFSGIVDKNEHIRLGGYPAPFRKLLGLKVAEFDPYPVDHVNNFLLEDGTSYSCDFWSDVIELEGATALATYQNDFYAGQAAVTRHSFGKGVSYYIGTRPEPSFMEKFLKNICQEADVKPVLAVPEGVEVLSREGEGSTTFFVLNHADTEVEVNLDGSYQNLIENTKVESVKLQPFGVAIISK